VLLAAREPASLLFDDLPEACGIANFSTDRRVERVRVGQFVSVLRAALDELRATYPHLLKRIMERITDGLHEAEAGGGSGVNRSRLAARATKVALGAREPRLRAFAYRLADTVLTDDGWIEALGSFVISKPPSRWIPGDEAKASDELDILVATFHRVEAITFVADESANAVRVGLTSRDGVEVARVVHTRAQDESAVQSAVVSISKSLPASPQLRLAVLSRLLWTQLQAVDGPVGDGEASQDVAMADHTEKTNSYLRSGTDE
jgi:hypothetical protein